MMCAEVLTGVSLSTLLDGIADVSPENDRSISGISADSREVHEGDLFLALAGRVHHGLEYLPQVERSGAQVVLWEPPASVTAEGAVPCIPVPGLSRLAGVIADRFFGEPSAAQRVVGVTGTDGKTSCTHFIAEALSKSGFPCGLVGTLGYGPFGALDTGIHTTPDGVSVHRILARIRNAGASRVAMEVSSHGLDQGRVEGVRFDTAVLTNLTRDHLDYHGTAEAYTDAKERLFRNPALRTVVLNLDDPFGRRLAATLSGIERVGYSTEAARVSGARSLIADQIELRHDGIAFRVTGDWGEGRVDASLLGKFNVANLLATLAVLITDGMTLQDALAKIPLLSTVPGRMQRFGGNGDPLVVVDYAHTPNALGQVLRALREHGRGKLVCVFGCGGDRDKGKRSEMARIAECLADLSIVTDDNPRSENPEAIAGDIVAGFSNAAAYEVVRDRLTAIARAIDLAGPGDTVLVAGKGHEDYQLVGDQRLHFSDTEAVSRILGGRG